MTTTTDRGAIDLEASKICHRAGSQWSYDGDKHRIEFFTKYGAALIAAVEALRDDLADLEALRTEDHAAIRQTILEKEAAEAREVELAGALGKYGRHLIDYKLEGPPETWGCRVGITDLPEDCRCGFTAALAATPAQAMERARAKDEVVSWAREIAIAGDVVWPDAFTRLDALGFLKEAPDE